jgi:hypothetical protein
MAILMLSLLIGVCECPTETLAERIERADVVFRGELSNLSEDVRGCSEIGQWNHSMLVKEVYKGEVVERVAVQSPAPDLDPCGVEPQREGDMLIYATETDGFRVFKTELCMGTKPIEEAEDDLDELGDGTPPGEAGGCFQEPPAVGIGWLLVLGFVVRRRSRGGIKRGDR